ncbi:MAG: phospho-N-acetylmuramoyl-pentapeptide-transferase [Clostridia bacterium]|nr:phospho-N-acetylmuramoyl-pentapeptide-transferase [Clostridia bacterium]
MELWLALLLCVLVGFAVSYILGFAVIPWLHKLKFGQTILDIGPSWHKKKQGTPTMGGILIIAGFVFSVLVVLVTDKLLGGDILTYANSRPDDVVYIKIFSGILMALAFSFIGFIDDYIKVVKKRNLGLTEIQKTVLQCLVIIVYLFTLYKSGVNYIFIPYLGIWENTFIFWTLGFIAIYGTVNAVNFTDGVDGLCTSVTAIGCIAFAVCAVIMNFAGVSLIAASMFGALIGFLLWNWNPSKVIMGDMGSFFLGGMVCTFAFSLDAPWLIVLIGVIYVAEFGSDIIQIAYVKTHNGKRLFKMAPIHHHYELSGWGEKKICKVFSLVTIIGSAAAVALTWFGRLQ